MELKFSNDGKKVVVKIIGQLDTTTAPQLEARLSEITPFSSVEIDCSELNYISSFGLRLILKIKKLVDDTLVSNVSTDVYDVFEMTGFTEMMKIEKRMREISVDGCKIIGKGAVGTVYRIADDTIVKVYREGEKIEDINKERELARRAFVLGIPTAIAYDLVKVGDRYGSVFELLDAKALSDCMIENPDKLDNYIDWYVKVLKTIHGCELKDGSLPKKLDTFIYWLDVVKPVLPNDSFEKLCKVIKGLKEDYHLIHGDYHVKNILVQNGEPFIIDMDKLSTGNPIIEFGFLYFSYKAYAEFDPSDVETFFGMDAKVIEHIYQSTVRKYFSDKNEDEIKVIIDKSRVIAYLIILSKMIRHDWGKEHIPMIANELVELLNIYDDINI